MPDLTIGTVKNSPRIACRPSLPRMSEDGHENHPKRGVGERVLLMGACLCVVIAGLRAAGPIIVPVLLAAYMAVLASGPIHWMMRRKVPSWAALTIVLAGVIGGFLLVALLLGSSVRTFSANLPEYELRMKSLIAGSLAWLEGRGWGVDLSTESLLGYLDPGKLADFASILVTAIGNLLSDTVFVLLATIFMLAEAAGLPRKLMVAFGPTTKLDRFGGVIGDLQNYLAIKTRISVTSGVLSGLLCWLVGVDYPLLWGVLAFLLNYVPTLGSVIALTPPTVLAFLLLGWQHGVALLAGYLTIEMVMGNVIEPRVMGKTLGLSTLVVFLSLVFWGWIWGPIGMFLSVPLTMVVKILLEHSGDLKWVAVMLGSGAEVRQHLAHDKARLVVPSVAEPAEPGDPADPIIEIVAPQEETPMLAPELPPEEFPGDDSDVDPRPGD
jgi:AI-2 transport protein TqsA